MRRVQHVKNLNSASYHVKRLISDLHNQLNLMSHRINSISKSEHGDNISDHCASFSGSVENLKLMLKGVTHKTITQENIKSMSGIVNTMLQSAELLFEEERSDSISKIKQGDESKKDLVTLLHEFLIDIGVLKTTFKNLDHWQQKTQAKPAASLNNKYSRLAASLAGGALLTLFVIPKFFENPYVDVPLRLLMTSGALLTIINEINDIFDEQQEPASLPRP